MFGQHEHQTQLLVLGQQDHQTQLLVLGQQEHRCYHREYHHQTPAAGAERIAGVGVAAAERIAAAAERIAAAAAAERIAGVAAAAAAGGTAAAAERIAALQDVDT